MGTCFHFIQLYSFLHIFVAHQGWDLARRCRTLAKSMAKVEKLKAKNAWQRKIQETQVWQRATGGDFIDHPYLYQ